jgi:radical SAM superfamily enzyme YgiQ (UPF0313 family)
LPWSLDAAVTDFLARLTDTHFTLKMKAVREGSLLMARIALISMYDTVALGLRALSAYLKREGHEVTVIYLKQYEVLMKEDFPPEPVIDDVNLGLCSRGEIAYCYPRPISETEWKLLIDLLREKQCDFVGLTLTSKFINTARAVTERIGSELGLKVIWGGMEPTVNAEFDIQHTEYLCIGEGEEALAEFAATWDRGGDLTGIQNIWAREDGKVYRNDLRPLIQNMDSLPFPDFDPAGKYEISNDGLWPREDRDCWDDLLVCTSRGCPYKCTFCIHNVTHKMYEGQRYVRRHSVDFALQILKTAKEKYKVKRIHFWDDIFSIHKEWLKVFLPRYKEEVGLPYWAYVYPQQCDKTICQLLKSAGEVEVRMGVQSGSEEVLVNQYGRPAPREMVLNAARNLAEAGIDYSIDIITNNPLETEEDCRKTLDLLLELPQPVKIGSDTLSYMSYFPNYEMTRMYEENKDSHPLDEKRYAFYNRLYLLAQYRAPDLIRKLAGSRFFRGHPEKLQYFFPGQAPYAVQLLQRTIPQGVRDRAKAALSPVLLNG